MEENDRVTSVVVDTNELLNYVESIGDYDKVIVPVVVLMELDELKNSAGDTGFKARRAIKAINEFPNVIVDIDNSLEFKLKDLKWEITNDHLVISSAIRHGCPLVTGDALMAIKAEWLDVEVILSKAVDSDYKKYTGVKEINLNSNSDEDQELLSRFYSLFKSKDHKHDNIFELVKNQYLVLWNDEEIVDMYLWDGERHVKPKYRNINNNIKPRNKKQELLFNLLQNDKITVKCTIGPFGSGKDYVMISHALDLVENKKFDKIVWVRNNVEVAGSNPIGYLPSDLKSKLLPYAGPLMDHCGGEEGLNMLINKGMVEIAHLGFIRGRDIKNSIIYVSEAENNSKEHIQLLLGRVGEGSQLWINGDLRQIDDKKFVKNNGLNELKKLGGNKLFGMVTLDRIERSDTAKLADLLD